MLYNASSSRRVLFQVQVSSFFFCRVMGPWCKAVVICHLCTWWPHPPQKNRKELFYFKEIQVRKIFLLAQVFIYLVWRGYSNTDSQAKFAASRCLADPPWKPRWLWPTIGNTSIHVWLDVPRTFIFVIVNDIAYEIVRTIVPSYHITRRFIAEGCVFQIRHFFM